MLKILFLLVFFFCLSTTTYANSSSEGAEKRAIALGNIIRCPVCAGQTINDSNNEMSKAMRAVVREQLKAGHSDADVLAFFQQRYGDGILLIPPKNPATLLLWVFPLLGMLGGGFIVVRYFRRQKTLENRK